MENHIITPGKIIGIVGGGQLGKMMAQAAQKLGYKTHIYSDRPDDPALAISDKSTCSPYTDLQAADEFISKVDIVTFEFENIPFSFLEHIQKKAILRPNSNSTYIAHNRIREKEFINKITSTAKYKQITSAEELKAVAKEFGGQGILKIAENGYDGKGQYKISGDTDFHAIWQEAGSSNLPKIVEEFVDFDFEISVIAARSIGGEVKSYAPVKNDHKNGILSRTTNSFELDGKVAFKAQDIAKQICQKLDFVGVLAVEFFVLGDDLIVNEIAPRPHNSGHITIETCLCSQFEQAIRAICGLHLGDTKFIQRGEMVNLIGDEINQWPELINQQDVSLHIYGKSSIKPGRKMGHYVRLFN